MQLNDSFDASIQGIFTVKVGVYGVDVTTEEVNETKLALQGSFTTPPPSTDDNAVMVKIAKAINDQATTAPGSTSQLHELLVFKLRRAGKRALLSMNAEVEVVPHKPINPTPVQALCREAIVEILLQHLDERFTVVSIDARDPQTGKVWQTFTPIRAAS